MIWLRSNSRLRRALGEQGLQFLKNGLDALTRILPHVETLGWQASATGARTSVTFVDANKRQLRLVLALQLPDGPWTIRATLQRRRVAAGHVGSISRTIDARERMIATEVLEALSRSLAEVHASSLSALRPGFDERVVATHLVSHHHLDPSFSDWLITLRRLAEQTYENKALAFGCIIDGGENMAPVAGKRFPTDFLERKRYRALSDGYRTAYRASGQGALLGFVELRRKSASGARFYPEWCEDLATQARDDKIGLALTRQGDILVLDHGRLSFTYRFGRWQYWNHAHLVDLLKNAARVQRVRPQRLSGVVRAIYRAALDVSFRRTGGLFVVLRSQARLPDVAPRGEAIGDSDRDELDAAFDQALGGLKVQSVARCVLAELAGLDGAVVLSNTGQIVAYGSILAPKRKGRVSGTEGSRTKAAIGASYSGIAVKISADGDITVFTEGQRLVSI